MVAAVAPVGDLLLCLTDGTPSGNRATVGTNWSVAQANLDGAVIGPASVTDGVPALFDGTTGKLLKATTFAAFKTALALAKGDVGLGNVLNVPQREALTANRTYYVRTDGSDSNTGLANTSGGAFLTIQKAINVAATLDLNGFTLTIQIANGTYTEALTLKNVVGFATAGDLVIQGNTGDDDAVVIKTSGAATVSANGLASLWRLRYVKLVCSNSGQACVSAQNGSTIEVDNVVFGHETTNAVAHLQAFNGGRVRAIGNYAVDGPANRHVVVNDGGLVDIAFRTVTFRASMAFATALVHCAVLGVVLARSMTFTLGAFAITGTRYAVSGNGVINTLSGGATYFPGDASGSSGTGGLYL